MVTRSYYRILFYLYCHSSTYFSLTLLRHSQTCICAIEVWGVKKQHALISKCLWIDLQTFNIFGDPFLHYSKMFNKF